MKWFDFTFDTPAENLACDEALLDLCERDGVEVLRFWESREPFVVVGYGNRVASEVNVEECERRGVPILRRCSGGGTVVQGPGCLNYNLTLKIPTQGPLTNVSGTNEFVMERNRAALGKLLKMSVFVQGHTDLTFSPHNLIPARHHHPPAGESKIKNSITKSELFKFSGNAQRRRRHSFVLHGTILYDFDLSLIDALLWFPSSVPNYRAGRDHAGFVRNIPAPAGEIRDALKDAWRAKESFPGMDKESVAKLVHDHYGSENWNLRR